MAIFGFKSDAEKAEEERIRKRADEAVQQYEKDFGPAQEEAGIEELELEESVPGGQYLGMMTPMGFGRGVSKMVGKKLIKEGIEEGAELAAKKGGKKLVNKLANAGPPKPTKAEEYYKQLAAKQRSKDRPLSEFESGTKKIKADDAKAAFRK